MNRHWICLPPFLHICLLPSQVEGGKKTSKTVWGRKKKLHASLGCLYLSHQCSSILAPLSAFSAHHVLMTWPLMFGATRIQTVKRGRHLRAVQVRPPPLIFRQLPMCYVQSEPPLTECVCACSVAPADNELVPRCPTNCKTITLQSAHVPDSHRG